MPSFGIYLLVWIMAAHVKNDALCVMLSQDYKEKYPRQNIASAAIHDSVWDCDSFFKILTYFMEMNEK